MKNVMMLMGLLVGIVVGCGTQPATLFFGGIDGALDIEVGGTVNPDLNVIVDASFEADVNCTIVCDLNTGECETVCDLDPGTPATPEELGEQIYLASCSACHGDPPGSGFAPNLAGESAADILDAFNDAGHAGGSFPNLLQADIDDLEAYFATL